MSVLTTLIQHHSRSPTNAIKEKEIHCTPIGKKERKLSLLTDDITVYVENLEESTKIFLELKNYSTTEGYKVNTSQSLSYKPVMNNWNLKLHSIYIRTAKNEVSKYKSNKTCTRSI